MADGEAIVPGRLDVIERGEKMRKEHVLLWTLAISLLLHVGAFLAFGPWWRERGLELNSAPPLPTRVVTEGDLRQMQRTAEVNAARNRSVVESVLVDEARNPTTPARSLGERTQRVEKETVAPGFGSVQGGRGAAKSETPRKPKPATPAQREELLRQLHLGGMDPLMPPEERGESPVNEPAGEGRLSYGSMDQVPKDVAVGTQTILNMDEYVYASFFNRVKREVAPRWEPDVQRIVSAQGRRLSGSAYHTEAYFWIDRAGRVVRVEILRPSGENAFDEAARKALMSLPEIRNPPEQLRESSGLYRMQLGFIVNLERSGMRFDYIPDPRL